MKNLLSLLCILFCFSISHAQTVLTGRPEQDCTGALPICDSVFTQPFSYEGWGADRYELPANTCLSSGENNVVWYIFTTSGAGNLAFKLTPIDGSDDYDFALFNITGHTCANLRTDSTLEVRCNYALNNDLPGGPGDSTGIEVGGSDDTSSGTGPTFNSAVVVTDTPQTFVLMINNFTSGGSGYTLDFRASTTGLVDIARPHIIAVDSSVCDTPVTLISLRLSRPILCDSIAADGSQFTITGPSPSTNTFAIDSAFDSLCIGGGEFANTIFLRLKIPLIVNGNYSINMHASNGGNRIVDVCLHEADDTTCMYSLSGVIQLGFTDSISGDTLKITNQANPSNTVYYTLNDGHGNTYTYPDSANNIVINTQDTYTLCQYTSDSPTCTQPLCKTISILGIAQQGMPSITLYPNPTTGLVHLQLPPGNGMTNLQVYNILGERVMEQLIQPGVSSVEIDLTSLPEGAYLLKAGQGNDLMVRTVVKY